MTTVIVAPTAKGRLTIPDGRDNITVQGMTPGTQTQVTDGQIVAFNTSSLNLTLNDLNIIGLAGRALDNNTGTLTLNCDNVSLTSSDLSGLSSLGSLIINGDLKVGSDAEIGLHTSGSLTVNVGASITATGTSGVRTGTSASIIDDINLGGSLTATGTTYTAIHLNDSDSGVVFTNATATLTVQDATPDATYSQIAINLDSTVGTLGTNYVFVATGGVTLDDPVTTATSSTVKGTVSLAGVYSLTVVNGTNNTGGSPYFSSTIINIEADTPPAGQVFTGWTSNNGGSFANAASETTTFTMPAGNVNVTATYKSRGGGNVTPNPPAPQPQPTPTPETETPWENPVIDVNKSHWFYDDVKYVHKNGLFAGTSANTFSPQMPMTRGMVFMVLARMSGIDVEGADPWYSLALAWGIETNLTDGTNPKANVSREQLVTLLWRFAGSPGADAALDFTDAADVSDFATQAMAWAVSVGIIRGNDDGTLNPQGDATRAEVAAIMRRFAGAME